MPKLADIIDPEQADRLRETAATPQPTTLVGDTIPLVEKAVRADDTIEVKIIQPGWNTSHSRYYPADVLERDAAVFGSGLHMFWDHPTVTEAGERPERSLRDLAAVLVSDARWVPDHKLGAGLYADAQVRSRYRDDIDEIAEHIGVSIRANGMTRHGEMDGHFGAIVDRLTDAASVDFVTQPGAGGQIRQLFEAAGRTASLEEARNAGAWLEASIHRDFTVTADRLYGDGHISREERVALSAGIGDALDAFRGVVETAAPQLYRRDPFAQPTNPADEAAQSTDSEEEPTMPELTEAQVKKLIEDATKPLTDQVGGLTESITERDTRIDELEQSNARFTEAEQVRVAHTRAVGSFQSGGVNYALALQLPGATIRRVCEAAAKTAAIVDGKLDEAAFDKALADRIAEEARYLHEAGLLPTGDVTELGEATVPDDSNLDEMLEAELAALPGMDEGKAKAAAAGRTA